jgi:hypothetical protein
VSDKVDSYSFAVLLLELLTGKTAADAVALHMMEPDLFKDMQQFTDTRAGAWPKKVVKALAAVAERCIMYHPRKRAAVRDVVSQLAALSAAHA